MNVIHGRLRAVPHATNVADERTWPMRIRVDGALFVWFATEPRHAACDLATSASPDLSLLRSTR